MTKAEQLQKTIAKHEATLAGISPNSPIRAVTERALRNAQAELNGHETGGCAHDWTPTLTGAFVEGGRVIRPNICRNCGATEA